MKNQWFLLIFQDSTLQKTIEKRCYDANEKNITKKHPKVDFDVHFGAPKPPEMAPKSSRDAKKLGLEQSLFCNAMEPNRKSSEVNGTRALLGINLARHMIRSSPSIH